MGYAKEAFYSKYSNVRPDCDCGDTEISIYFGAQQVYALCRCGNWILTDNYKDWEKMKKDQQWVGPTMHGERE